MKKKQCKWCKETIDESKLSKYASGDFCSKLCARKYSQSFINHNELKPGNCSACGKEMMIKKNASSKKVKCDDCRKKHREEYLNKNKIRLSKQQKEYRENNKEECLKRGKNYRNSFIKFNSKSKARQEIELYEEEIRESTDGYLQCKCAYCGDWFKPIYSNIRNRLTTIYSDKSLGEGRLYCSDPCKKSCPTYNRKLYPKGFKPATSREVQPELRQMVLARDNYTCKRCGKTKDELIEQGIALHCHHLEGIQWEPLMSADLDMCITYCQPCHVKAHQGPDCGYHDMKCIY